MNIAKQDLYFFYKELRLSQDHSTSWKTEVRWSQEQFVRVEVTGMVMSKGFGQGN